MIYWKNMNTLKGINFCITGTLVSMKRKEAQEKIEGLGGRFDKDIKTDTTFLVAIGVDEQVGKHAIAISRGIPVINEEQFIKYLADPKKAHDDKKVDETPKRVPPKMPEVEAKLTRKEMGIPQGTIFHIEYMGSNGKTSSRDIEIQEISKRGGKLYLYAFCHIRRAVRSFLIGSILSMSYEGRQIKNLKEILEIEYPKPEDLIAKLVAEALEHSSS
jgi:hypothetical protein